MEQSVQTLSGQVTKLEKEKQTLTEELKYIRIQFQDAKKAKDGLEKEVQILQSKDNSSQRQIQLIQDQLIERVEQIKKLKLGLQQARKVTSTRRHHEVSTNIRPVEAVGAKRERVPKTSGHLHPPS